MKSAKEDQSEVFIASLQELRTWLEEHHSTSGSVWLVREKKSVAQRYIQYDDIVDELLCFGWVDSLPRSLDNEKTMLRISPRNPKSSWSRLNKERVARLQAEGRIQAAGLNVIDQARANGSWSFLDDVEDLTVPYDLRIALEQTEKAWFYFNRFPASSRRGILEWIKTAKQDTTRLKRINETANKAGRNLKANHPKGRDSGPKEE